MLTKARTMVYRCLPGCTTSRRREKAAAILNRADKEVAGKEQGETTPTREVYLVNWRQLTGRACDWLPEPGSRTRYERSRKGAGHSFTRAYARRRIRKGRGATQKREREREYEEAAFQAADFRDGHLSDALRSIAHAGSVMRCVSDGSRRRGEATITVALLYRANNNYTCAHVGARFCRDPCDGIEIETCRSFIFFFFLLFVTPNRSV